MEKVELRKCLRREESARDPSLNGREAVRNNLQKNMNQEQHDDWIGWTLGLGMSKHTPHHRRSSTQGAYVASLSYVPLGYIMSL